MRTRTRVGWVAWTAGVAGLAWALPCWAGPSASGALGRLSKGDASGARREYEELIAKAPGDARLAFNAGVAAHQMGDWEAAGRHHEAALASSDLGLQQRAFFGLGSARFRQGEAATEGAEKVRLWEDALRQYQAALGLNPADTAARENLDVVREQLARLQREQQQDGKQDSPQQGKQGSEKKDKGDPQKDGKKEAGKDSQKDDAGPSDDSGQKGGQQGGKDGGKDGQGQPGGDKKDGASRGQDGAQRQDGGKEGRSPEDNQGGRMGENKARDGKEGARGQRGKEGKEGDGTPRAAGRPQGEGEKGDGDGAEGAAGGGAAAQGQPGVMAGEDGVDGKMAMRFAERLLDAHKREERALIWAVPRAPFQDGRNGGRKTW